MPSLRFTPLKSAVTAEQRQRHVPILLVRLVVRLIVQVRPIPLMHHQQVLRVVTKLVDVLLLNVVL